MKIRNRLPGMPTLPLRDRDGHVKAEVLLDDEDYAWASAHRWHSSGGYAKRRLPNPAPPPRQVAVALHTEILDRMGHPPGSYDVCDHENRDSLDCRRQNLRPATFGLNATNRVQRGGRPRVLPDPESRPCSQCGAPFVPRRKTANIERAAYCSRDCQRESVLDHSSAAQSAKARARWAASEEVMPDAR